MLHDTLLVLSLQPGESVQRTKKPNRQRKQTLRFFRNDRRTKTIRVHTLTEYRENLETTELPRKKKHATTVISFFVFVGSAPVSQSFCGAVSDAERLNTQPMKPHQVQDARTTGCEQKRTEKSGCQVEIRKNAQRSGSF